MREVKRSGSGDFGHTGPEDDVGAETDAWIRGFYPHRVNEQRRFSPDADLFFLAIQRLERDRLIDGGWEPTLEQQASIARGPRRDERDSITRRGNGAGR